MSLHFILDGYNIIKHSQFSSQKKISNTREDLLKFISEKKPCGSANNRISVVFDGADDGICPTLKHHKNIEVLFSYNDSADNKIKKMVENSLRPNNIVVVSDDREIGFFIRAHQAQSMDVTTFISKGMPSSSKLPKDLPKQELSYSQTAKINAELTKIWLK